MAKHFLIIGAIILSMAGGSGFAAAQGELSHIDLPSKVVGVTYAIDIVVPASAAKGDAKIPVLYCTDWYILADYLKALPGLLNMGRLVEPFIMVGISQQGGTANDWAMARTRDFTPGRPTDDYSKKYTYAGAISQTGGAIRFLTFLKEELIPRIELIYPADPTRRGFVGYSLGGLMATIILVKEPPLFQYYLIGSPSVWYNDYSLTVEFEKVTTANLESIKKIYLSVGEEESWEMLKGYGMLRDALETKGFTRPRAKMEIISEAGHVGAMPISLANGIRFLFAGK